MNIEVDEQRIVAMMSHGTRSKIAILATTMECTINLIQYHTIARMVLYEPYCTRTRSSYGPSAVICSRGDVHVSLDSDTIRKLRDLVPLTNV
eukprot:scaffold3642_cov182-Amphora_coffeaeformis.AAC.6